MRKPKLTIVAALLQLMGTGTRAPMVRVGSLATAGGQPKPHSPPRLGWPLIRQATSYLPIAAAGMSEN
jgi:hypothetical protein